MNVSKLLAPDFALGKMIVLRRAIADSLFQFLRNPSRRSLRLALLALQVKPTYTMVLNRNLNTLYELVQQVNQMRLPGDIVECGVWNGGSAAIMALAHRESALSSLSRTIWLFDSFQGLPKPGEKDGEQERQDYFTGWNKGDVKKVRRIFTHFRLSLDQVNIVPGWFSETLLTATVDQIAVLHIDADWYDSVKIVLDSFYPRVVPGGFIMLDDYEVWTGCKQALDDYFAEHSIKGVVVRHVAQNGGFFQKPLHSSPT